MNAVYFQKIYTFKSFQLLTYFSYFSLTYLYMRVCISFIFVLLTFPCLSVKAQLIPDSSLGKYCSTVNPSIEKDLIEGGAIRNNNLFHSFKEFNVNPNQKVFFSNPDNITNILTRVTGNVMEISLQLILF